MTDNEIKKALEICSTKGASCKNCPAFVKVDRSNCKQVLIGALDIINRLQAEKMEQESEIKILKDSNKNLQELYYTEKEKVKKAKQKVIDIAKVLKTAKAEAYKEFAEKAVEQVEKARQKYQRLCEEQGEEMEEHMYIHFNGITKIINNLFKKMVGEDK